MSLLLFFSLSMFMGTMADRYWLLRAGDFNFSHDRIADRLKGLLGIGFGQKRLLYEKGAGWMHVGIFAGFLVVSLRTVTLLGRGFDAHWNLPLFDGPLGLVYALLKDTFAVLVLLAIVYGIWRRLFLRPARLHLSLEAVLILLWIAILMITDLVGDAAGMRLDPHHRERGWAWASTALAPLFADSSTSVAGGWLQAMYWSHCVLVLAFLNFLPFGKHFHVLTALPAVYLRRLGSSAGLEKMDFEGKEVFGVGKLE